MVKKSRTESTVKSKKTAKKKTAAKKSTSGKTTKPKTAKKAAVKKPSSNTTSKSKKKIAKTSAKKPQKAKLAVKSNDAHDSERMALIQQTAYYIAEKRGFTGGDPEQDWLLAEKQVDQMLKQSQR